MRYLGGRPDPLVSDVGTNTLGNRRVKKKSPKRGIMTPSFPLDFMCLVELELEGNLCSRSN